MNATFRDLLAVLERETKIYDDLFKISKQKTQVIVENKVSDLESITKIEHALVFQIARLENEREALVAQLARAAGKKPEELTMSALLGLTNSPDVERLKKSQLKLSALLDALKASNETNGKLISNSLEYIDFSLNLMTNTQASDNRYGRSGNPYENQKRSMFDMKL